MLWPTVQQSVSRGLCFQFEVSNALHHLYNYYIPLTLLMFALASKEESEKES